MKYKVINFIMHSLDYNYVLPTHVVNACHQVVIFSIDAFSYIYLTKYFLFFTFYHGCFPLEFSWINLGPLQPEDDHWDFGLMVDLSLRIITGEEQKGSGWGLCA